MNAIKVIKDLRAEKQKVFVALHLPTTEGAIEALDELLVLLGDPADDGPEVALLRPCTTEEAEDLLGYPTTVIPGAGINGIPVTAGGGFVLVHDSDK